MTRSLTKDGRATADQAAIERGIARGRAMEANRTYEMLNAVPTINPAIPPPAVTIRARLFALTSAGP